MDSNKLKDYFKIFDKNLAADMSLAFGMNTGQFSRVIGKTGIENLQFPVFCDLFPIFGAPRILFAVPKSNFIG